MLLYISGEDPSYCHNIRKNSQHTLEWNFLNYEKQIRNICRPKKKMSALKSSKNITNIQFNWISVYGEPTMSWGYVVLVIKGNFTTIMCFNIIWFYIHVFWNVMKID